MQFSRAIAFAAFTVLKWLFVVMAVLFAAMLPRLFTDGAAFPAVGGAVLAAIVALMVAYVMHRLARAILH